jgi:hypothetical protein
MKLSTETHQRIRSSVHKLKPPMDGAAAERVIEALIAVDSLDALRKMIEQNPFLCEDWVVEMISDLKDEAEEADDRLAHHNLRTTLMALAFQRDTKLRSEATVPPPLCKTFEKWAGLARRLTTLEGQKLDELIATSRVLIDSKQFEHISLILRRDILLNAGKALLIRFQSGKDPEDLDGSLGSLDEATRLCPGTSPDFAECTTYGGLALLLQYERMQDEDTLETAIAVLRPAVAAASDSLQALLGQAANGLANAHLLHFQKTSDIEDLQNGTDVFVYGLAETLRRREKIAAGTIRIGGLLSEQLRALPAQQGRLERLTGVLEAALEGEFDEDDSQNTDS